MNILVNVEISGSTTLGKTSNQNVLQGESNENMYFRLIFEMMIKTFISLCYFLKYPRINLSGKHNFGMQSFYEGGIYVIRGRHFCRALLRINFLRLIKAIEFLEANYHVARKKNSLP